LLRQHVRSGARGLKVLKELGLHYRDSKGNQVFADDPGLSPIWRTAAELGVPVLIHQSDPYGFFEPVTPDNEHYDSLKKYPSWSFCDPKFPPKDELIRRRDNLVARERDTTFILPHVANYPENLAYVGTLLEKCPNVHIDFSARMDELGRQPYSARAFFLRYADRILFGTDMPVSAEMYRTYFRFLETFDEGFYPPDYDGTFDRVRWPICGIGLPKDVLAKIYYANALRLIPGLKEDTSGVRFVK
jgi:predicted TIM-barrel fold metal-dependent hydrolase